MMGPTVQERKLEQQMLEKLVRVMEIRMQVPEFAPGGVPVKVAAAVYGKAPCYIHEGIRAGWLPIGHARPGGARDNFYISPLKLWQDTGFVYRGQSVQEIEAEKKQKAAMLTEV